jgi:hypothetical protein
MFFPPSGLGRPAAFLRKKRVFPFLSSKYVTHITDPNLRKSLPFTQPMLSARFPHGTLKMILHVGFQIWRSRRLSSILRAIEQAGGAVHVR